MLTRALRLSRSSRYTGFSEILRVSWPRVDLRPGAPALEGHCWGHLHRKLCSHAFPACPGLLRLKIVNHDGHIWFFFQSSIPASYVCSLERINVYHLRISCIHYIALITSCTDHIGPNGHPWKSNLSGNRWVTAQQRAITKSTDVTQYLIFYICIPSVFTLVSCKRSA